MGKSKTRLNLSTGRGCPFITAHRGRISVVSIIFAPMTFPTERELSFLRIGVCVVTSSGKEVPRAMTVKPIIVSLIPIPEAIVLPDETRNSAPKTMDAVPRRKRMTLTGISCLLCVSTVSSAAL